MQKSVLSQDECFFVAGENGCGVGGVLGAVYVAYLTPDYRLVNAYPIRTIPGEDLDVVVSRDMECRPSRGQRSLAVTGLAAELLHIAITGRVLGDRPEDASPGVARLARDVLAASIGQGAGFAAADVAVRAWGDFIRPWFGCVVLDSEGRILMDDPRYVERLEVPLFVEGEYDERWLFAAG